MSNTEWGYKFTVTAGHLGRFQTGKHCSERIGNDFLELFCWALTDLQLSPFSDLEFAFSSVLERM